ncbi:SH3 domain-containing protein [Bartonella bacilliformis]|uniref:SH3 domain-containing protein n=1 Tax=Bartonella bacilliformis TaxID=774 RepID=UPI000067462E|nr:SH3 domain-containing protein [Bartonella bacilliformis]AUV47287.1 SH3 domain-containing protein [Bartonella bacilliformis]QFZ90596.1 SH3 domain-containing protein [Bartonella bacilliformis]
MQQQILIKAGPSTQYTLRGLIPAGQAVFVYNCKGNWCQIYCDSRTGWTSAYYLSFKDGNDLYHAYTTPSTEARTATIRR